MKDNKKVVLAIIFITIFSIIGCFVLNALGLDDISKIKNIIRDSALGYVIYTLLLTLQIIFIPINSMVLLVPAMLIFGAVKAFILSLIGLVIGSIITFYLGRIFGNQLVSWMVGYEKSEELKKKLGAGGKLMLPILFLIPIFPDELICLVAGISNIKIGYFTLVTITTRAIDLAFTCFIGAIIPFHGWWLLLWGILLILSFIASYLLAKYQILLKQWVENLYTKKKR